jgi:predicted amino acid racemase
MALRQEGEEEERRIQHQQLPFKSEWDEMIRQAQVGVKSLVVDARQIKEKRQGRRNQSLLKVHR